MDEEKFRILWRYYEEKYNGSRLNTGVRKTSIGRYVYSPSNIIYSLFRLMKNEGSFDDNPFLLDAGSGDGRIIAIAALLGIRCVGVEFDQTLLGESKENLLQLSKMKVLDSDLAIAVGGDFTQDETYRNAGIEFSSFTHIFNYINNEEGLITKMVLESPKGTTLILGNEFYPREFNGLKLERVLRSFELVPLETLIWENRSYHIEIYRKV